MHLTCCPSWLLGTLALLFAVPLIWWSLRLWHHPSSLEPESLAYRIFVAWLRRWQPELWKKREPSGRLTAEDIKFVAALNLLGGVVLVVIGAIYLSKGWLVS